MTALSVALVLCCAMVCGTRLVLLRRAERGQDVAEVMRRVAKTEAAVLELEGQMIRRLDACASSDTALGLNITEVRQDVEKLKAQSAFRSLG